MSLISMTLINQVDRLLNVSPKISYKFLHLLHFRGTKESEEAMEIMGRKGKRAKRENVVRLENTWMV